MDKLETSLQHLYQTMRLLPVVAGNQKHLKKLNKSLLVFYGHFLFRRVLSRLEILLVVLCLNKHIITVVKPLAHFSQTEILQSPTLYMPYFSPPLLGCYNSLLQMMKESNTSDSK